MKHLIAAGLCITLFGCVTRPACTTAQFLEAYQPLLSTQAAYIPNRGLGTTDPPIDFGNPRPGCPLRYSGPYPYYYPYYLPAPNFGQSAPYDIRGHFGQGYWPAIDPGYIPICSRSRHHRRCR